MSFDRNKNFYHYTFSNKASHTMTPIEAHKYAYAHKVDILVGPGFQKEQKEKSFDGFGWHSSLQMNFRGPAHYRSYLREHGLVEASINDKPMESKYNPPVWTEELIWRAINVHGMQIDGVLAEALLKGELDYPETDTIDDDDGDDAA